MCRYDIHLRVHAPARWRCHERRQVRSWVCHRKLHGGNLDRAIYGEHRRNHRVEKLNVLAWRHAVDVVFVVDAPPCDLALRIAG